jgi:hypothetical protein
VLKRLFNTLPVPIRAKQYGAGFQKPQEGEGF